MCSPSSWALYKPIQKEHNEMQLSSQRLTVPCIQDSLDLLGLPLKHASLTNPLDVRSLETF